MVPCAFAVVSLFKIPEQINIFLIELPVFGEKLMCPLKSEGQGLLHHGHCEDFKVIKKGISSV